MAEKWSDELPDDFFVSEEEKIYMNALVQMKAGLAKGLDFETAATMVSISDEALKRHVLDDVLKVIIAEEHFVKDSPLDQISRQLNLPIDRLETARAEMLEDVEESTLSSLKTGEKGTEH